MINNYRIRKIDDYYFLSTDHGSSLVLSFEEYRQFKAGHESAKLKTKLEEHEIILTENNLEEIQRLNRNRYSFLSHGTGLHIIVVTLRCDMNCIYCHASSCNPHKTQYDMDIKTAKKTVDFIFQSPSKSLTIEFQGGEPLLNWKTTKFIIDYATKKNPGKNLNMALVTNLNLMDDEKLRYLKKMKVHICTSLDGPKALHDKNRLYKKSNYQNVVHWLSKIEPNALVTLTRDSLNYPKEIVDEYVQQGIETIHLRFLNNLGVASHSWKHISYSVEEYIHFWQQAAAYIYELKKKGVKISERIVTVMLTKIFTEFDANYMELRSPCGAVIGQLAYNYNGDVYTCDEARMLDDDLFRVGTVDDNFYDVVTNDKACNVINSSINDQFVCDACAYKPFCGICPVCNYAEEGNVIGKNGYRCKIYMAQFDWVIRNFYIKSLQQGSNASKVEKRGQSISI